MRKVNVLLFLVVFGSLVIAGCDQDKYYLGDLHNGLEYSFLDHVVTCTEYSDINISVDYCTDGNDSVGFWLNETTLNWSTICCEFKSDECFDDNQPNSTSGLSNLCSYNVSNTSQVFLTNTTQGWRALCTKGGIAWVDNMIDITNQSTICADNEKLGLFTLSFNMGWNATCCVNIET